MGPVATAIDGAVATVTIANPPVNALADPVLESLAGALGELTARVGARAVILTGAGERTFVAGADLRQFAEALGDEARMRAHVGHSAAAFAALDEVPVPVIAAVGGHAVGGGLELALACDLIVADPRARFGLPEVGIGLIPGAGGTQRLPRRVSRSLATRMVLAGEMPGGEEALAAGLVDRLSAPGDVLAAAAELAEALAAKPGRAVRAAKAALRASERLPPAEGLEAEREAFLEVAATADAREGVTAFLAKRDPEFRHA
jgi:enoyl-CoA hydratase/carnithine racemase